jgi:ACR3 family arsenite transporter
MTGLAWLCLPDLPNFRAGVILVGLARCIAMVLLWNQLARGDAEMCAVMVAFNSVLQIVLYAPLSVFYLRVVSRGSGADVGFWPVAKSVLLFLGVPLVAGIVLRVLLIKTAGRKWFEGKFMPWFGPWALIGLLYTIVVMFASQGKAIVTQLGGVARVAVPMLVYFLLMYALSLVIAWYARMPYAYATTQVRAGGGAEERGRGWLWCSSVGVTHKKVVLQTRKSHPPPPKPPQRPSRRLATISSSRSPSPSAPLASKARKRSPPPSGR